MSKPVFRPLRGSHDSLKRGTRGKFRHTPTGPFPAIFKARLSKSVILDPPKLPFLGTPKKCDFSTSYKTAVLSENLKKLHFSDAARKWRFVDIFTNLAKNKKSGILPISEKTTECDDQEHWFVCH